MGKTTLWSLLPPPPPPRTRLGSTLGASRSGRRLGCEPEKMANTAPVTNKNQACC